MIELQGYIGKSLNETACLWTQLLRHQMEHQISNCSCLKIRSHIHKLLTNYVSMIFTLFIFIVTGDLWNHKDDIEYKTLECLFSELYASVYEHNSYIHRQKCVMPVGKFT